MAKNKGKNIFIGCVFAICCEFIYGMSYLFTKTATDAASALSLLGWRFLVAFLVMSILIWLKVIKINLRKKKLKPLLIIAIVDPIIYFIAETVGISHTTASESGSFMACIPIAALLASTLLLHKKPHKLQVIGVVTTLIGVCVTVFAVGLEASFSPIGYIMLLIAVSSYAIYCVLVDKAEQFTGMEITYIMIVVAAVAFGVAAVVESFLNGSFTVLATLPFKNTAFLMAILYQGICCSVLAFFMSNFAIANIGVNRSASFVGISTVVSIAAGVILLKENFTVVQILGAILIIAGVYIANAREKANSTDTTNI